MKRRTKRKIKNFILKTLAYIAGVNLILFALLVNYLTRDGWILALIVNGIGVMYLWLLLYANGWIYDTDPHYEREEKEALKLLKKLQ